MGDMEAYALSKLAITVWLVELANGVKDGPLADEVNPRAFLAFKMIKERIGIAGNNLNTGADILVAAVLDPEFGNVSGELFDNDKGQYSPPHAAATD